MFPTTSSLANANSSTLSPSVFLFQMACPPCTSSNPVDWDPMCPFPIGGAGNHRLVGSVSGLAARGCGAAGSGPCGESSKCPKSFRVGTLNVGTMKGKASEVVETLSRRRVDLCCLQETRWKMEGGKQIYSRPKVT